MHITQPEIAVDHREEFYRSERDYCSYYEARQREDNAQTEALLKASFEVEVLQVADELQVTLQTDQRSEIAAAIVKAGIGLKELRTKQSSLEDTFLAWTEEGGL